MSRPVSSPFHVTLRGYDREQVDEHLRQIDAENRLLSADRDAAAAHSKELSELVERARVEILSLREDVRRLSEPPQTPNEASDRISRMLRLAADEVVEMRANARAEAAETVSIAEQKAQSTRDEADAVLTEMRERAANMEREHASTMEQAKAEAARIVANAQSQAAQMEAQAQANRDRIQHEFDLSITARREQAIAMVNDLEARSKDDAAQRIAAAVEKAEELRALRSRILSQLSDVHNQLAHIPEMVKADSTEAELLPES